MKTLTESFRSCLSSVLPLTIGSRAWTFIPAYSYLRLSAQNNQLEIQARNGDAYALARAECNGELTPVCISADKLKRLTDAANGVIEITAENQRLIFKSVGTADVSAFSEKEFQEFPKDKLVPIGVNTTDLASGIEGVMWAGGTNDPASEVLNSVHVKLSEKQIVCEAANGGALSQYKQSAITAPVEFLLPLAHAKMFLLALKAEGVELSISDNLICASSPSGEFICKRMAGVVFPDTQRIVNVERTRIGEFPVVELASHLVVMKSLAGEKEQWSVIFESGPDGCMVRFAGQNKYEAVISGKFAKDKFKTRFDVLLPAVNQHRAEKLVLYKHESQIMFQDSNLTHIVSLLRV